MKYFLGDPSLVVSGDKIEDFILEFGDGFFIKVGEGIYDDLSGDCSFEIVSGYFGCVSEEYFKEGLCDSADIECQGLFVEQEEEPSIFFDDYDVVVSFGDEQMRIDFGFSTQCGICNCKISIDNELCFDCECDQNI